MSNIGGIMHVFEINDDLAFLLIVDKKVILLEFIESKYNVEDTMKDFNKDLSLNDYKSVSPFAMDSQYAKVIGVTLNRMRSNKENGCRNLLISDSDIKITDILTPPPRQED